MRELDQGSGGPNDLWLELVLSLLGGLDHFVASPGSPASEGPRAATA